LSFVIDCSIAVAWLMPDEQAAIADSAIARVMVEGADVPNLFPTEVGNVFLVNVRRRRWPYASVAPALADLQALEIRQDTGAATDRLRDVVALAERHGLTVYDAAYLELALRLAAPLATLDNELRDAARAAGAVLLDA
jgi:predicted nucleic acid-binding protein